VTAFSYRRCINTLCDQITHYSDAVIALFQFAGAMHFNRKIDNWNVGAVTDMSGTDLTAWKVVTQGRSKRKLKVKRDT
jgi:surface protein